MEQDSLLEDRADFEVPPIYAPTRPAFLEGQVKSQRGKTSALTQCEL